ncbi:unnamed protein product, partial [marine sediment metagenome]
MKTYSLIFSVIMWKAFVKAGLYNWTDKQIEDADKS